MQNILNPEKEKLKKLWIVKIRYEAYVLATDEEEVDELLYQIETTENPQVIVTPWNNHNLIGWDDKTLVYHLDDKNISLHEAKTLDRMD